MFQTKTHRFLEPKIDLDTLSQKVLEIIENTEEPWGKDEIAIILEERDINYNESDFRYALLSMINGGVIQWLPDRRVQRNGRKVSSL